MMDWPVLFAIIYLLWCSRQEECQKIVANEWLTTRCWINERIKIDIVDNHWQQTAGYCNNELAPRCRICESAHCVLITFSINYCWLTVNQLQNGRLWLYCYYYFLILCTLMYIFMFLQIMHCIKLINTNTALLIDCHSELLYMFPQRLG